MDSLTQIVLGAAVGEAVLGRKIGNKAILWGAIAGTIPDLDVLLIGDDPIRELTIHRGFSHSIVFAILMAPILGFSFGQFSHIHFLIALPPTAPNSSSLSQIIV
jgi:inner membrane protein